MRAAGPPPPPAAAARSPPRAAEAHAAAAAAAAPRARSEEEGDDAAFEGFQAGLARTSGAGSLRLSAGSSRGGGALAARIADLCAEDKAKIARLIEQVRRRTSVAREP